uniref:Phosphatidylinositol 3-kinase n=1 Tax=Arcella intermedia TaxID=1963864 RepID=A0A6B2KWV1_9EUKA
MLYEDGKVIDRKYNITAPFGELKKQLMNEGLWPESFKLKIPAVPLFFTYEHQPFQETPYFQNCPKSKREGIKFVLASNEYFKMVKHESTRVSKITSTFDITQLNNESEAFLQSMARMRTKYKKKRGDGASQRSIPINLATGPPMNHDQKVLVSIEINSFKTVTVEVKKNDTCDEFIDANIKRFPDLKSADPSEYLFRVVGKGEYLYGPHKIWDFEYVQHCVTTGKNIQLVLAKRADIEAQTKKTTESVKYGDMLEKEEQYLAKEKVLKYDHNELQKTVLSQGLQSVWNMTKEKFTLEILSVKHVPEIKGAGHLYMVTSLYNGTERLCEPHTTKTVPGVNGVASWHEVFQTEIPLSDLPRNARLCFVLYGASKKNQQKKCVLAWVNCLVFDYKHELITGQKSLKLWKRRRDIEDKDFVDNPVGTCAQVFTEDYVSLFLSFDSYANTVVFPTEDLVDQIPPGTEVPNESTIAKLEEIFKSHSLVELSPEDKDLIWRYRDTYCKNQSHAIKHFLAAVPKTDRFKIMDMHRVLKDWEESSNPIDALPLLDSKYPDARVRSFAVSQLKKITNVEIEDYLLQLVQALKHEPYHNNLLTRFLLKRAIGSKRMGHYLYWFLKCELLQPRKYFAERFRLLLQAHLSGSDMLNYVESQEEMLQKLGTIVSEVKAKTKKNNRTVEEIMKDGLEDINQFLTTNTCHLMIDPGFVCKRIKIEKCKVMDSKMKPLWLVFENADPQGSDFSVIYKMGDDLRQDMLVLQMFRIMDRIWKKEKLDLMLSPYNVLATGAFREAQTGMIEAVTGSNTIGGILKDQESGTFSETYLLQWLLGKNQDDNSLKNAIDNFTSSAAGYSVATYILGIGDRHCDNIMIKHDGRVFHIDYGHILGNFKEKLGVKREIDPFVFTPAWRYVITRGKENPQNFSNRFLGLGNSALELLRKNRNLFVDLFVMMLASDMPELNKPQNLAYLVDTLSNGTSFALLVESIGTAFRKQMDDAFHQIAHKKKKKPKKNDAPPKEEKKD